MQLGRIALKLRAANTTFGNYISGAAELGAVKDNTLLGSARIAFVIPLADDCSRNSQESGVSQVLTERFGVVVALPNDASQKDKTGFAAMDAVHEIRDELFSVLVGWDLGFENVIVYRGGKLLDINRAHMWYQFEFEYTARLISTSAGSAELEYTEVDERQQVSQLPDFSKVWTDYVLSPSVKLSDILADPTNGIPLSDPDMSTYIDLTDNPDAGPYSISFGTGFDFDNR